MTKTRRTNWNSNFRCHRHRSRRARGSRSCRRCESTRSFSWPERCLTQPMGPMPKRLGFDINCRSNETLAISTGRRTLGLRAQEISLADADAVVPENRVRRREMEKEVELRVLNEVVRARHPFAFPTRLADDARGRAVEILRRESVEVRNDGAHSRLQFLERLFRIGLRFRGLAGEERRREFRRVTADLDLAGERELVGGQAEPDEDVRVERLRFCIFPGGTEPLVE